MKLKINADADPIPDVCLDVRRKLTEEEWKKLEDWIEKFPYEIVAEEKGFGATFRAGEVRNERTEYRRLRVSIGLSSWMPLSPEPAVKPVTFTEIKEILE